MSQGVGNRLFNLRQGTDLVAATRQGRCGRRQCVSQLVCICPKQHATHTQETSDSPLHRMCPPLELMLVSFALSSLLRSRISYLTEVRD